MINSIALHTYGGTINVHIRIVTMLVYIVIVGDAIMLLNKHQ